MIDEIFFEGEAAWIGKTPVHVAEAIDLYSSPNMRAPGEMHGKFDRVWIYERELFQSGPNWPLVLDECIRLLGPHGYLIARTRDNEHGTLFHLKSMVARRMDLSSELISQKKLPSGDTVTIIDIRREKFAEYRSDGWSIGILSNGTKSENVYSLVDKLIQLAGSRPLQIIIAGPEMPPLPVGVDSAESLWTDHYGDGLPRIGEKKNWIVRQACHSNLAIFHDRYQVNDDFFIGFDRYGLDFDFVSVRQYYETGAYYPSYIGFPVLQMKWQRPSYDPTYQTLHEGHFVNGGLIIIKSHVAKAINFNSLLLHNEAEDVELSFALRSHGIVPRMNFHSSAVALGVPENYTATFEDITQLPPRQVTSRMQSIGVSIFAIGARWLPSNIKYSIGKTRLYAAIIQYLRIN